jgi:iron transport multicopper oxidase
MSAANEDAGGSEPIPNSALIGDTQNTKFNVKPKTTYLVHVLNIGSFVGAYLKIDGHEMTIVEADGVYTESQAVDELYLTVAQRYSVLVTTKDDTSQNSAILSTLDTSMFVDFPPVRATGFLKFFVLILCTPNTSHGSSFTHSALFTPKTL